MSQEQQNPLNEPSIDERSDLLEDFSDNPEDDSIWETAYDWVHAETHIPESRRPAIADDIPGDELVALAKRVRSTPQSDRYAIMAEHASNGRPWFDVLATFSSPQIEDAEEAVIEELTDGRKVDTALDIGTGTGKSLAKLVEHADRVVGVDRNKILLGQASTQTASNTGLLQASADSLPVRDHSVDIASSTGITGALDARTADGFYREIARVLKPGGVYVDGVYYYDRDGKAGEELSRIVATSKSMLADMIVDTVSGKFGISEHLSHDKRASLLGSLGLHEHALLVPAAEDDTTHSLITVITKD